MKKIKVSFRMKQSISLVDGSHAQVDVVWLFSISNKYSTSTQPQTKILFQISYDSRVKVISTSIKTDLLVQVIYKNNIFCLVLEDFAPPPLPDTASQAILEIAQFKYTCIRSFSDYCKTINIIDTNPL